MVNSFAMDFIGKSCEAQRLRTYICWRMLFWTVFMYKYAFCGETLLARDVTSFCNIHFCLLPSISFGRTFSAPRLPNHTFASSHRPQSPPAFASIRCACTQQRLCVHRYGNILVQVLNRREVTRYDCMVIDFVGCMIPMRAPCSSSTCLKAFLQFSNRLPCYPL